MANTNALITQSESNVDEAVAPYFATVYTQLASVIQAFALYSLISANVVQVPLWLDWDWAYFLRGLSVFLLVLALWHRYVTELAYVAAPHYLHSVFPFLFGVLQVMLANPRVLKPSPGEHNLSYFTLLMSLTALTGMFAHANAYFQHKKNRNKMRFQMSFGADAQHLYSFWEYLHIFFAIFMLVTFLLFLVLCAAANWAYKSWEEIVFPLITTLFIALAVYIDARFCATHRYARPAVRDIYKKLYGTSLDMGK